MTIKIPTKLECLFTPSRYKVLYGGRGAGKSQNIARALLAQGFIDKHKILCAREIQRSITESVHSLLVEQIEAMELQHFYSVTQNSIIGENGTEFIFAGLRSNIANIKSIPNITRAWVEEAQTVSKASMSVLIPTVRAESSEIWLSFNPELEDDPIYQDFVVSPPSDAIVVKVGWEDNPWFPEVLKKEMEDLKLRDYAAYEHVWEGKCKAAVDGAVFANELRIAGEEHRITTVKPVAGVLVNTYWDLGLSDNTAIWFVQKVGLEYRIIDYYQSNGNKMAHYIEKLQEFGYSYGTHYLPHDAEHEQLSAQSSIKAQILTAIRNNKRLGENVQIVPRVPKKALGIEAVRSIFPQCLFDKEKTKDGLQCLRHYAYAKDADTGRVSKEPKHDDWSHGTDAFMCFAQAFKKPIVQPQPRGYQPQQSFWAM